MGRYGIEVVEDDHKIKASTVPTSANNPTRPHLKVSLTNSWRYGSQRGKTRSTSTITKEEELPGASTAEAKEISSTSAAVETKQSLSSINIQGWSKDTIIKYFHLKDGFLDKADFLWEENSSSSSLASLVEEASRENICVPSRRDEPERVIRGHKKRGSKRRLRSSSSSSERHVPPHLFAETLPFHKKQCTEERVVEVKEKFGSEGLLALQQQSERQPGQLLHEGKHVHKDQKRKRSSCSSSFSSVYPSTPRFYKKERCAVMAEADEVCQPMREKQLMCEEQPLPSNYPVTFEELPMRKEQPIMLEKHFMPEEQQHEGKTVRNETPSSTLTDAPETVRTCLRNVIDISDFSRDLYDQVAKGMLSSTDLERTICECLHEIQFDMSDLQHIVRTSQLNTLSNQAEAIRSLAGVRITQRLQKNLLLKELAKLQNEVRLIKAFTTHAPTVSNQVRWVLNYENLKKVYVLDLRKPFKSMNLNEFLRHHVQVAKVAKDAFDEITCFLRSLFSQICYPDPSDIWKYSHRAFKGLLELPGTILHPLIDFIVEARGLGQQELSSWRFEGLKRSHNAFWLRLADCEEEREREFKRLLKAKLDWVRISKSCIAKALEDVRGYCMCEGRLVPAENGDDGLRWADKKAMTPEAWRQLTLIEAVPLTEAVHAELLPF